MKTPIFMIGGTSNPARYYGFSGGSGSPNSTGTGVVNTTMSVDGSVSNLNVVLDTAPGTGTSWKTTLWVNNTATALTATISDTATSASDTTHSVSVSPGDTVMWYIEPTGSPAAANISVSAIFESTTAGESLLNGGGAQPSNSATNYAAIYGTGQFGLNWQTTEGPAQTVVPTGFTIDQMRLYVNIGPAAGKSNTVTIYKNGVATALSAVMTGTNTASDLTHSVHFSAGDTISIEDVPSGTPATRIITWGFRVVPDTDGETPFYGSNPNTWTNSSVKVQPIQGVGFNNGTTGIGSAFHAPVAMVAKKFYGKVQTAPGSGKSWAIDVRLNGSAQSAGFSITNTSNTGNNTSSSVSLAAGDYLDVLTTPSGSPASTAGGSVGMVLYIAPPAPPAGNNGNFLAFM